MRRALQLFKWLMLLGILFVGGANCWILESSRSRIFTDIATVPANNVGLVLGTSSSTPGGSANPFFAGRIAAAAQLYHAGKVRHLLLSGDNRITAYDEPRDMKQALIAADVPESVLPLDDAGFRTLDSMARAKGVFGLSRLTVIIDDFHAPRALVLGRHFDIETIAFCPPPVPMKWSQKTRLREIGARVKTVLDLYVLRTKPHFLGAREQIN
jgi:SanA protein